MTYTRSPRALPPTDPVNALMSWPVAAVESEDTLDEVARLLVEDEIGAVLVLHQEALVGLVSERDVAAQVAAGADGSELTAGDVMSQDLVTVPPEAPILEAAQLMHEAQVRHLPVVSDGVVAGIVSMRDLFEVLLLHLPAQRRADPGREREGEREGRQA